MNSQNKDPRKPSATPVQKPEGATAKPAAKKPAAAAADKPDTSTPAADKSQTTDATQTTKSDADAEFELTPKGVPDLSLIHI